MDEKKGLAVWGRHGWTILISPNIFAIWVIVYNYLVHKGFAAQEARDFCRTMWSRSEKCLYDVQTLDFETEKWETSAGHNATCFGNQKLNIFWKARAIVLLKKNSNIRGFGFSGSIHTNFVFWKPRSWRLLQNTIELIWSQVDSNHSQDFRAPTFSRSACFLVKWLRESNGKLE